MFFRRRPFVFYPRPWGWGWRRRRFYRWGCLPGCFTLVLAGLLLGAVVLVLV
jgi:hypothetical protein